MASSTEDRIRQVQSLSDPFARNALRVAYHLRKYVLLYVCGALGALALGIFPVVNSSGGPAAASASGSQVSASGSTGTSGGAGSSSGAVDSGLNGTSSATGSAAGGSSGGASAAGATASGGGGSVASGFGSTDTGATQTEAPGVVRIGTGTTRGGFACSPTVHQIPWSNYSVPCQDRFSGGNGGAITRGVTASTITIAARQKSDSSGANALANQAEGEAAGGVSDDQNWQYVQQITKWMNSTFELYGRQVKLVKFGGQGNGTNEALGQGQAAACADADTEASSVKAFGGIAWGGGTFESGPFADCAARYHIYIPEGSAYFPESWYIKHTPYVWAITMNCSQIAFEVSEWLGKQLAPYPTKWAANDGVIALNGKQRKFATYVPNNAEYQECVGIYSQNLQNTYHVSKSRLDQYNYALDISTFPQDAQKGIIQFSADQDTTVVLACDPISPIFMTQDAVQQNYYPEWALIGVAGTDTDNWAQLWDQKAIDGHLWGLSQLASTQLALSKSSDAGRSLTAMGLPVNLSSVTDYYELESMFNQLQAAGPNLTAANIAAGSAKIPLGTGPFGTWHFGNTHSAIIDSRQIYWNGNTTSLANGKAGTYVEIYSGKRFQLNQFPTEQPPYYP